MTIEPEILKEVVALRIHPGIGIARLGNSPDAFFVGPEAPGHAASPAGGFKDSEGRVKRQAARFRVYGLDADGQVVAELSADDAEITWNVHLANKKGAFYEFTSDASKRGKTPLRNATVQPDVPPDERDALIIDPGPRSVSGRQQASRPFEDGHFQGVPVTLGQLRTDDDGHLLVLGGAGRSASVEPVAKIKSSYNNEGWYDDTADGPVSAKVTLPDERVLEAEPAWVIVAPPNFAPAITNLVSLYDRVQETTGQAGLGDRTVNYHEDVRPLLARLALYSWVNKDAMRGHGPGKPGDFLAADTQVWLTEKTPEAAQRRRDILERLRVPPALAGDNDAGVTATESANYFYMPQLAGDGGDPVQGDPATWMSLLPGQYTALGRWAEGDFGLGSSAPAPPFEETPLDARPAALDRAALEPCVGAPLCPGIEMTYISEQPETFVVLEGSNAVRIAPEFGPGDVTRYMALPWQADFHDCFDHWWPAQRPDDVLPEAILDALNAAWGDRHPPTPDGTDQMFPKQIAGEEVAAALVYRVPWSRGMPETTSAGGAAMVRYWSDLGFVVPKKTKLGEQVFVETERAPLVGLDARSLFFQLMNVDNHPECLPEARAYVDHYLKAAQARQSDPMTPDIWWSFPYTPQALDARLTEIYNDLADNAAYYDPATDTVCRSREDVVEWLWQWGPFNMTDGAWLRNINRAGPMNEVHAMLFSILCDEMGNGNPSHSHANMARDLLHSVGRYPEPIGSQAFAMDTRFLDSAFTVPTFALAISQFTERYLPEIIGMTMFLEWCVLDLKPSVELLRYYDIDPHFFVLHIGIDNAADGHGHLAQKAVHVYLEEVREEGGEPAVQEHWQRIWNGFVAYGTTGTFGQDLKNLLDDRHRMDRAAAAARAAELIRHKAPYGQLNHGEKKIGANRINDWFRDPPAFLDALVSAGYVVPGDPENSSFLRLLSFENGPMYNVFTENEIGIWRDWIRALGDEHPARQVSPAQAMVLLLDHLRERQTGERAHDENMIAVQGGVEQQSITAWFARPDREFLAALADPANGWIAPGDPGASDFLSKRLSEASPMGRAFDDVIAGTGGQSGRDIVRAWITASCPLPPPEAAAAQRPAHLWLRSSARVRAAHPTGQMIGMGGVH